MPTLYQSDPAIRRHGARGRPKTGAVVSERRSRSSVTFYRCARHLSAPPGESRYAPGLVITSPARTTCARIGESRDRKSDSLDASGVAVLQHTGPAIVGGRALDCLKTSIWLCARAGVQLASLILGVSAFYHDSAACLLDNGSIVAAAQEERFTRKKGDSSFPAHAVEYCLRRAIWRSWASTTSPCSSSSGSSSRTSASPRRGSSSFSRPARSG